MTCVAIQKPRSSGIRSHQDERVPREGSASASKPEAATTGGGESAVQVITALIKEAKELRPRIVANLEVQGFQHVNDVSLGGTTVSCFLNSKSLTVICLHDALRVSGSAAGSVNITLYDDKPHWVFHVAAPTAEAVSSQAIKLLREDPRKLSEIVYHTTTAKQSTHDHESCHVACMMAGTPWGKVMFTHLLDEELDRVAEQREKSCSTEQINVHFTQAQDNIYIRDGVSEHDFKAALLISELRAHRYNWGSSGTRASEATIVFASLERCLETIQDQNHPEYQKALNKIPDLLASWQTYISNAGYESLAGAGIADKAAKMLKEHGSLRTSFDPVVPAEMEAWMKSVTLAAALGVKCVIENTGIHQKSAE